MERLAFMRHGERRKGEADPALTSVGRRMAREACLWLADTGFVPTAIVSTPTQRTLDSQEEAALVFPDARLLRQAGEPEHPRDLEALLSGLEDGPALLVGHHPTLAFLLRTYGPAPQPVSHHHFSATLLLEAASPGPWAICAAWPGRPGT